MNELVRIFKCRCDGRKFKLTGEPNTNPTLEEKIEYGDCRCCQKTNRFIKLKNNNSDAK